MRTDILLLIAGMTLVTYIPRMLPAVLLEKLHFGPKVEKFLQLIPYTAMAALVFPGVVTLDPARPISALQAVRQRDCWHGEGCLSLCAYWLRSRSICCFMRCCPREADLQSALQLCFADPFFLS